jgi:predicted RNA-binding protein
MVYGEIERGKRHLLPGQTQPLVRDGRVIPRRLLVRRAIMCESNVYLIKDGKEELIMESVGRLVPEGKNILIRSIFGEETVVEATLKELDLTGHRVVLETR